MGWAKSTLRKSPRPKPFREKNQAIGCQANGVGREVPFLGECLDGIGGGDGKLFLLVLFHQQRPQLEFGFVG